jgi:subtilisin family serine protease
MAGRLLASVTLLLSGLSAVAAAPRKGDDFFLGVPVSNPDAPNPVPHRFIVVYNNTFDDDVIIAHEASITAKIAKRNLNKRSPRTGKFLSTTVHSFNMGRWHAMALEADDRMITEIFTADEVAYVEQDQFITVNRQLVQGSATTGLSRLSHARVGSRGYVFDDTAGEGITAYVVDTGIRVTHSEFEGRAVWGENFVNEVVSAGHSGGSAAKPVVYTQ